MPVEVHRVCNRSTSVSQKLGGVFFRDSTADVIGASCMAPRLWTAFLEASLLRDPIPSVGETA